MNLGTLTNWKISKLFCQSIDPRSKQINEVSLALQLYLTNLVVNQSELSTFQYLLLNFFLWFLRFDRAFYLGLSDKTKGWISRKFWIFFHFVCHWILEKANLIIFAYRAIGIKFFIKLKRDASKSEERLFKVWIDDLSWTIWVLCSIKCILFEKIENFGIVSGLRKFFQPYLLLKLAVLL